VDAREEDGSGCGEVREIDEAGIAGDWCAKMMRSSSQVRIGTPDLPAVAIQSTTWGKEDIAFVSMDRPAKDLTYEWACEPKVPIPDYPQAPNLITSMSIPSHAKAYFMANDEDVLE
jgi:hypothetical protein